MEIIGKFLPTGILLLATIGFGFWVSHRGRPYNDLLFNLHKLLALAGLVFTGIRFFRLDPFLVFPTGTLILAALTVVPVLALFTTGAIMSIRDEESRPALLIHQGSLVFIIILITGAFTLFLI
jgi:hypothetical protein